MSNEHGYFIDRNGKARSVQDPGGDFVIEVAGGQSQDLGELAYPLPLQE